MKTNIFRASDHSNPANFVSLVDELGAYEAMWAKVELQSYKKIAALISSTEKLLSDLVDAAVAIQFAERALVRLQKAGYRSFGVVLNGTSEYPKKLLDAKYPVELLYYTGWWDLVESRCISVVGSRAASATARKLTADLVQGVVEDGYTVVSGLAKGVDTVAHETAIQAGGKTIAVIGTPLTEFYPRENAELQRKLAEHYLVISQVPVERYYLQDWKSNRFFFPERNITMSALSEATIIVEASDTSGTLTQARAALAQGRKLFIMDQCFRRADISWPSKYLEKGAMRVGDYGEVRQRLDIAAN